MGESVLLVAEGDEVLDDGAEEFEAAEEGVEDDAGVVHGAEGAEEGAEVGALVVGLLEGHLLAAQVEAAHLHTAGYVDLDVHVLLAVGLRGRGRTSNMSSRALTVSLLGSLAL